MPLSWPCSRNFPQAEILRSVLKLLFRIRCHFGIFCARKIPGANPRNPASHHIEPERQCVKGVPVLSSTLESWFALQVAPRREKRVASILEYKGHEAFLPTYQVRRNWSDRVKTLDQPMFPGYVFCRVQKTGTGLVLATPGVIRVVSFGGKPCPIANEEIDSLQRLGRSGGDVMPYPYTQIGQKVRIAQGPFSGVVGVVVQVRNQRRLVVAVETIFKAVSIAIDALDVERVLEHAIAAA